MELTDPILQPFDTLCVFQETVDPVADERLARFVTSSHMRSTPSNELPPGEDNVRTDVVPDGDGDLDMISQELLRKDIPYARAQVPPVMHSSSSSSSLDEENDSVSLSLCGTPSGVSFVGWRAGEGLSCSDPFFQCTNASTTMRNPFSTAQLLCAESIALEWLPDSLSSTLLMTNMRSLNFCHIRRSTAQLKAKDIL